MYFSYKMTLGGGFMVQLNKLVRDKVPSLITKNGGSFSFKLLSPLEHQHEITKKFYEEIKEYSEAPTKEAAIEELVDIFELIHAAIKLHDISYDDLELLRQQKRKLKGGFDKGIFINDISDNN